MSRYWLSQWLEYHDIDSGDEAARAVRSPSVVSDLQKTARKALKKAALEPTDNFSVVAGRGIDLSGQLDCSSDSCRTRQVNELFGHVWHYFDRIIVQDGIAHEVTYRWNDEPALIQRRLLSHIKVLFYLRSIGAEDLVDFRPKPFACSAHWQYHAEEAGLGGLVGIVDDVAEHLLNGAVINFPKPDEDFIRFNLDHPDINPVYSSIVSRARFEAIPGSPKRKAAVLVARAFLAHLTSDVTASNNYNAALGTVNTIHDLILRRWRGLTPQDALINLKLPVLEGLQPWDLIAIRREESEYFSNFRDSLLAAVRERIEIAEDESALELAEEIRLDIIEPELNRITARLKVAQNALAKKSAVGLVLGGLSTTCRILAGLSSQAAAMGGTTVALGCSGAASAKYFDDLKDISLSNMFFLWKARGHAPHD